MSAYATDVIMEGADVGDIVEGEHIDTVKVEVGWPLCLCCLGDAALSDVTAAADMDPPGSYCDLLEACFAIRLLGDDDRRFICDTCVDRLKDVFAFRCQIEENRLKLKAAAHSRLEREQSLLFKYEYPSEEEEVEDEDDASETAAPVRPPEKPKTKHKILVRSKRASKKAAPVADTDVTPENAYAVAVRNLLDSTEDTTAARKRNNVKIMGQSDFRNYRRLYYRIRYAKSIPFKLDESALSCQLCNQSFPTHKHLVSHMGSHYPNHICDLCGKSFVLKEQLAGHMRTHNSERKTCHVCDKVLKKSSMTRHMRTHTGNNEVYACPSCPERFVSFSTRLNHMAEVHSVDILRFNCTICSKKFHLSSSLSKHVRRCHFQELNVQCPQCGKGFFDNKSLKNHMLIHTGEKKYQCEICLKSYGRKCTIREHMKIHNNVRPHKCTICHRAFTQKCTLNNHLKIHNAGVKSEQL